MNIYRISQTENRGYDTYSDAVVVAKNEEEAKRIHPSNASYHKGEWWRETQWSLDGTGTWSHPDNVKVELVGKANKSFTEPQVICASFHAG